MSRAAYAAERERSIGLGVMGFHSFLQSQNVPIESVMAKVWNKKMFKHIKEQALAKLFDMDVHTKHVDTIFQRVFGES